jgi:hypothetical protein
VLYATSGITCAIAQHQRSTLCVLGCLLESVTSRGHLPQLLLYLGLRLGCSRLLSLEGEQLSPQVCAERMQ